MEGIENLANGIPSQGGILSMMIESITYEVLRKVIAASHVILSKSLTKWLEGFRLIKGVNELVINIGPGRDNWKRTLL